MSIADDLAILLNAPGAKGKGWAGPTESQWLRICRLAGESREAAMQEMKDAILKGDVIATWYEKKGEFCLRPAERT